MDRALVAFRLVAAVVIAFAASAAHATADEAPTAAEALFARALESRFNVDSSQRITLTTTPASGAQSVRVVEMAIKQIRGRVHALAEIVDPVYLRGTRVLSIEVVGRNDDQFMYMPATGRVRRISGAQRADLFFGSDVTLEDFERHYADDFRLEDRGRDTLRGEEVSTIAASPHFDSNYELAVFMIADDALTLEIRYFKKQDGTEPFRVVKAFRADDDSERRSLIPGKLEIDNRRRGTTTIVDFEKVVMKAAPSSLFITDALQSGRRIPYLDGDS